MASFFHFSQTIEFPAWRATTRIPDLSRGRRRLSLPRPARVFMKSRPAPQAPARPRRWTFLNTKAGPGFCQPGPSRNEHPQNHGLAEHGGTTTGPGERPGTWFAVPVRLVPCCSWRPGAARQLPLLQAPRIWVSPRHERRMQGREPMGSGAQQAVVERVKRVCQ